MEYAVISLCNSSKEKKLSAALLLESRPIIGYIRPSKEDLSPARKHVVPTRISFGEFCSLPVPVATPFAYSLVRKL